MTTTFKSVSESHVEKNTRLSLKMTLLLLPELLEENSLAQLDIKIFFFSQNNQFT